MPATITVSTGMAERAANMRSFGAAALELLKDALTRAS
jgi:hypothetical protein